MTSEVKDVGVKGLKARMSLLLESDEPSEPKHIAALGLRGPIGQGTAGAQTMLDSDGMAWVIKFLQNEQGPRSLVNELLGFQMADFLGILHPEFALVEVDSNVLPPNGVLRYHYQEGSGNRVDGSFVALPGLHFATRLVTGAQQLRPADMDRLLPVPIGLEPLAGVLVLDLVMNHWDRKPLNPNLLVARDPSGKAGDGNLHRLLLIDMGMSIGGGCWEHGNLLDASLPALDAPLPYGRRMADVLSHLRPDWIMKRAAKLEQLSRDTIKGMIRNVPDAWDVRIAVRDALFDWLQERCRTVPAYLESRLQRQDWWL